MDKFSIETLKSMAYDCLVSIEQNQANLRIINQEILNKQKPTSEVTNSEEKDLDKKD